MMMFPIIYRVQLFFSREKPAAAAAAGISTCSGETENDTFRVTGKFYGNEKKKLFTVERISRIVRLEL